MEKRSCAKSMYSNHHDDFLLHLSQPVTVLKLFGAFWGAPGVSGAPFGLPWELRGALWDSFGVPWELCVTL